jgi:hypothetical protein
LKSAPDGGDGFSQIGDELPLSGPALSALLQAVLQRGVPFRFRAKGFSMSPFIKDGDVITVSPLAGARPRLGEVVAFQRNGSDALVVHRVVGWRGDSIAIQGDFLPAADDIVPRSRILGRVKRVERGGREVRLGLGPERAVIALLTRSGVFRHMILPFWFRIRRFVRRTS